MGLMKVAILGYGNQGQAAYDYWSALGHDVEIRDNDLDISLPFGVSGQLLGPKHIAHLDQFDLVVRSPIIRPDHIVKANGKDILKKVTTVTNEFFRVSPSQNIVGVTGTKGKGTTATLIYSMLEAAGHRAHIGGNIGTPPLDLLKNNIEQDDWIVLELANFQLIDFKYAPKIGVCVMVVPEHLNWHTTLEEYFTSKKQMFARQTERDIAIYYHKNPYSKDIASAGHGKKIPYYHPPGAYVENDDFIIDGQSICPTSEIKILGRHNWQNICAAITAFWQVEKNIEAIRQVLHSFSGMEHRLEFVREFEGVRYYDDSFGTSPETAIVAIEAFKEPKVLILGGSDKGSTYSELARIVKTSNVVKVILIGEMAQTLRAELDKAGYKNYEMGGTTMAEVVRQCRLSARKGDVVLLSTACASFGLFKNYKDRAEQFIKAVRSLA